MRPHERLAYSPIENRPPLKLPDGLRLIVWPVMSLEVWDISRPMARMVISPPQGQPLQPDHPLKRRCSVATVGMHRNSGSWVALR
jgi:hypothetical protein